MIRAILLLPLLVACKDEVESGEAFECTEQCGDIDGEGLDTGDIPNILGNWTSSFATEWFDETCELTDLNQTSESWFMGAMRVGGYAPDGLYAVFDDDSERFVGAMNSWGGVMFSGRHMHKSDHEVHLSFGGLLYDDKYRGLTVIEGFAYIGVDLTDDGDIDCDARGTWKATKSN